MPKAIVELDERDKVPIGEAELPSAKPTVLPVLSVPPFNIKLLPEGMTLAAPVCNVPALIVVVPV